MKEKQLLVTQDKTKDKEQSSSDPRPPAKAQTLSDCLTRHVTQWPTDSPEYVKRCDGIVNMLLETGRYANIIYCCGYLTFDLLPESLLCVFGFSFCKCIWNKVILLSVFVDLSIEILHINLLLFLGSENQNVTSLTKLLFTLYKHESTTAKWLQWMKNELQFVL